MPNTNMPEMIEPKLKPNVLQMLEIGKGCGLNMLGEAYGNYMNHYDCFFLIEKYHEQHLQFAKEMFEYGLLDVNNELTTDDNCPKYILKEEMTIDEAIELVKNKGK